MLEDAVDHVLRRTGGATSRELLLENGLTRHQLDNEVKRGSLVAPFPRAYCRPWDIDDLDVRERAALFSVGRPAALSHTSALRRWNLLDARGQSVHVTVPATRLPRNHDGLVVHRARWAPLVVRRSGLLMVTAATAVATSWPLIRGADRRAPAITAVRNRLVRPADLRAVIDRLPRLPGRRDLLRLVTLIEAGCESELEIWGHLHVFDVPGLRHAVRQRWIRVRGQLFRLDLAYEDERVAVELDGAGAHSSREQRERDMRRDAALGSVGWLTLRYSHRRLHSDIAGCRRDTLATLAARQQ